MKTIFLSLAFLSIHAAAQAAPLLPLSGTCHANILDNNGTIVRQADIKLTQIDPTQHFGLSLSGEIEGARVSVALAVGNYEKVGSFKTDKVFMTITRDAASASSEASGRAMAEGDLLNGDLITPNTEVDCIAKLNQ